MQIPYLLETHYDVSDDYDDELCTAQFAARTEDDT
jgi:hypothetical protein